MPGWCEKPVLRINGKNTPVHAEPRTFIVVDRQWKDGDSLELVFPMELRLRYWIRNGNSVCVDRGPLTYSLQIGEKYVREGGTDPWPGFEVYPTTAWNYGLVIDATRPLAKQFEVQTKGWPTDNQPFAAEAAPIEIQAQAKKIPNWQADAQGLIGEVQQSPVRSDEPVETVTLIPMGAARLRISAFPWIGEGPNATEWRVPRGKARIPASASHCWESDTTAALSDGDLPISSNDRGMARFTWWPHKGTTEWVQYDFGEPRAIRGVEVYWFDDTATGGGCRTPQSWKVFYKEGDQWREVANASACGVAKDQFNRATFDEAKTSALRIEVQLQPDCSAGILEWRIE